MDTYQNIKSKLLAELENGLPKDLHYHNTRHTADVIKQSERIAAGEKITAADLLLLKIAALYHDSGFLFTYIGHEAVGCEIARKELPLAGFNKEQIDIICGIIMATKIPQSPTTKLERIICDADLDYLGRDDFFPISEALFAELKERKFISTEDEWNERQVSFFKEHQYFTATNKKLREQQKQKHLQLIEAMQQ